MTDNYKRFWIADFESGKRIAFDKPVQEVYFGLDGEHSPIAKYEVIELAALEACQKRLDEAEVYLKSYVEHLLQVGPSFNYHLRKNIDTFLSQIDGDVK